LFVLVYCLNQVFEINDSTLVCRCESNKTLPNVLNTAGRQKSMTEVSTKKPSVKKYDDINTSHFDQSCQSDFCNFGYPASQLQPQFGLCHFWE